MDVEIVKKDGRKFRLSDYGVVKDFVVNSIDRDIVRDSVDGRPGSLDYGVSEGDRSISVPFILKAKDLHDYAHLRDELYSLLGDNEPFYIREMRRPKTLQYDFVSFGQSPKWSSQTDNEYVNGKQYLVRLDSTINPSQEGLRGEVSLEFVTSGLPYAESTYTTLELHDRGYSATAEKYGLVDNIDDEKVQYRFTESNFTVYNAGNVTVQPESMYLDISISGFTGSKVMIKNKTTGETLEINVSTNNHVVRQKGMNVMVGGINRFRDTNRRFISIVPGDNQFEIAGGTFSQCWFDFKYYYK